MPSTFPQSFLFPTEEWTRTTALSWLRSHAYVTEKVVREGKHWRARQFPPEECKPGTYGTKRWISRRTADGRGRWKPKKILAVYCRRSFER